MMVVANLFIAWSNLRVLLLNPPQNLMTEALNGLISHMKKLKFRLSDSV